MADRIHMHENTTVDLERRSNSAIAMGSDALLAAIIREHPRIVTYLKRDKRA